MPALPDAADPGVQVWRNKDGTACAYGQTVDAQHWMHLRGLASFQFSTSTDQIVAYACPSARLDLVEDAYYRTVLPMVLQVRGLEVLHASAVLTRQGVVALCAVSETGKSTLACALSRRGYSLWADDAVAFETSGPRVISIPLPFKPHLSTAAASFFGFRPSGTQASEWKGPARPGVEATPLSALCVLTRISGAGDDVVQVLRLSPAQAFAAILPHAYCFSLQDAARKRQMMQNYLALNARVPAFEIRFQTGFEHLSPVLDRIRREVIMGGQ